MSAVGHAVPRSRQRWPWLVLTVFFLIAVGACVLVVVNEEPLGEQVPFVVAFGMFGVVGATILSRAPGNRIGALMLWGSTATALAFLAGEIFTYLVERGTTGALPVAAGLVSNLGWVVGILPVLLFIPLLFPDGRWPSARWLPFAWLAVTAIVVLGVSTTVGEERLQGNVDSVTIENPLFVEAFGDVAVSDAVANVLLLASLAGSIVSLGVRFRRAPGVQRQQIKWVTASAVFLLLAFLVSGVAGSLGANTLVFTILLPAAAFLSLPVAVGVGVLQYRLYDLDVVVKKTLIAGTLVLIVVGAYGAVVWAFGAAVSERTTSLWFFAIALVLGVAFRPVTRFARRVADRLVYGRRATPYEVLTEFSERVGEAYATDDILGRMTQILGQGVGAASARVWLLVGGELRPESSWPSDAPTTSPLPVGGDRLPNLPGESVVEVRDRGELLGALSVVMPPNDPMTPAKEKLVRDLASQTGLVLRNVRLVEELRASQRRLVTAQDQERRRIERNIHDGAQQQLVALAVKARLARQLADRDAAKTAEMLSQIESETQAALEDLRDLARGIYPPLLADKGLPAAVEAQARKSPVAVDVDADGVDRLPQEVEAAVYFSVLEALQNVAKYAGATRASVHLRTHEGDVVFVVRDEGKGFDPSEVRYGTGLQGIADRLAALDGRLEIESRPSGGTVLTGRVPLGEG